MTSSTEYSLHDAAVLSLRRRQGFRRHVRVYLMINLLLLAVWLSGAMSSGGWAPWFLFPLIGWGVGLGVQGWTTHVQERTLGQRQHLASP
jgi:hypothetical protein